MQPQQGISIAIIRDPKFELQQENRENKDVTLLTRNYQNLENLIYLIESSGQKTDANYLRLAKLNRLKVLMELSINMVGRNYKDISTDERNKLEMQANRYHATYPLPGEEMPLYDVNEKGKKCIRLPIIIVKNEGAALIDINKKFRIDPNHFLKLYTNKLVDHAEDTTGLKFDNITVTIPSMLIIY
jgi:hypothetical protein